MKESFPSFCSPSSSSSSSSTPSSSKPLKHDVFLSFRGEDTRNNFTAFLCRDLKGKGIHTFIDDGLERGKNISQLFQIIQTSRCSILVISENYANSKWCLRELVKILHCSKTMNHIVFPIFFLVNPTHVKNKTGAFGDAFFRLQKVMMENENERNNMEELQGWKDALTEVGQISGWHLSERDNQAEFLDKLVLEVSKKCVGSPKIPKGLFGMQSRMEKLKSYANKSEEGVEFIGICGLGGIGKTTIATTFYHLECSKFECSSFLEKAKEKKNDLQSLERQLLSDTLKGGEITASKEMIRRRLCHKKVLVVIDDVDQLVQLEKLAGEPNWFGPGSRIIITTRDKGLLDAHGVREIYNVEPLDDDEAFQLFTLKAGFKDALPDEYKRLSLEAVSYAKGLPLALNVMGSSLSQKSVSEWNDQLKRLKDNPKNEITRVLKISFDQLEEKDKNIFLLITCCFLKLENDYGYDRDRVTNILDECGFNSKIGIRNLCDKSLLSIKDGKFWVHDLLREMARKILTDKSLADDLGKEIKVWDGTNASHVLKNCKAIEEIEALFCRDLSLSEPLENFIKTLSKMKKLKLFIFCSCGVSLPISFLEYLPNGLIVLDWIRFPFKYFPSSFKPIQLVEVHLSFGNICQLWDNKKLKFPHLRSIRLQNCRNLTKIFDNFSLVPNLKLLDLTGCSSLSKIDPSINFLGNLIELKLLYCRGLECLPTRLSGMKSLKVLNLGFCEHLKKLPEDIGLLKSLEKLDIRNTSITELPPSILLLKNLEHLVFYSSSKENMLATLLSRGSTPGGLTSLKNLNLRHGNISTNISQQLGCFTSLVELNLSFSKIIRLPASISKLVKLEKLHLRDCDKLRLLTMTDLPSSLKHVVISGCLSLDTFFDTNLQCNLVCVGYCKLPLRSYSRLHICEHHLVLLQNDNQGQCPDSFYAESPLRFDIAFPGSKIPDCVKLYPKWCYVWGITTELGLVYVFHDKTCKDVHEDQVGHVHFDNRRQVSLEDVWLNQTIEVHNRLCRIRIAHEHDVQCKWDSCSK